MTSQDKRKVALITGATGGIGHATAKALAKTGEFNLALHYNSASQETRDAYLHEITSALDHKDIKVAFFQDDLGNYDSVRQLHEKVVQEVGDVDVLFNNAGANAGHKGVQNLADVPIDAFDLSYRINTGSGILLTQLCLPHMEKQGWGRVIFDSSVAAFTGGYVGPHYASSKSAQHGFIHWLANNVAKKGITVNGVAPALIGGTNMMGNSESEEVQNRIAQSEFSHCGCLLHNWYADYNDLGIPVGRLGRPEEVAETVLWMVKNAYLTNKVIAVDGGYYPY